MKAKNENVATYDVAKSACSGNDKIEEALTILAARLRMSGEALNSPKNVKDYLLLSLAGLDHEEFHCLWLDAQNRLIHHEHAFRGTLTQTSVYPREVVKSALKHNASAVIFAHNHPSGLCEPSGADETLTHGLKTALALVDTRVLDHILVAGMDTLSFAERGLI